MHSDLIQYIKFNHDNAQKYDSLKVFFNYYIEVAKWSSSMFRGGTTLLPITSLNLSFAEFLARMNKAIQIHSVEHDLCQIEGNTTVASKTKRKTNALHSTDGANAQLYATYSKPSTFSKFVAELNVACDDVMMATKMREQSSKTLHLKGLASLKKHKDFDKPKTCLSAPPKELHLLSTNIQQLT